MFIRRSRAMGPLSFFDGAAGAAGGAQDDPPPAAGGAQDDPPAGDGAGQADPPAARTVPVSELAKERAARKAAEKAAEASAAKLKEIEDAQKSEVDKLRERTAEFEKQLAERDVREREQRVRVAAITSAAKLGYADPDDAMRLVDAAAIEFDEAGEPANVGTLLADLLKAKPYLRSSAATASGSADLGNGGSPAFSAAQLKKMTPAEINQNWDAIQAAAKAGNLKG
jgi:hypothetical protein